jgi:hypothetical protein
MFQEVHDIIMYLLSRLAVGAMPVTHQELVISMNPNGRAVGHYTSEFWMEHAEMLLAVLVYGGAYLVFHVAMGLVSAESVFA